jgi:hypothetical protein
MTAQEIFRQYTDAIDRGDIAAAAALVDDDFRLEGAGLDGVRKPEFIAAMKAQLDAFPDYSENPTNIEEREDTVHFVAHVTGTQRHALVFPGMSPVPPSGRRIQLPPEPAWVRVKDNKLMLYHVQAVPGGGVQGIIEQLK